MDELCQICGMRKATIVVKTNVNGVKSEQHLCAHCAAKLSAGENFVQDFFNEAAMLMSGLGDDGAGSQEESALRVQRMLPHFCGHSGADVQADARQAVYGSRSAGHHGGGRGNG